MNACVWIVGLQTELVGAYGGGNRQGYFIAAYNGQELYVFHLKVRGKFKYEDIIILLA